MNTKHIIAAMVLCCSTALLKADDLTVSVTNTSGSSSVGAVDLSVTGGVAPYVYSWSGPSGYSATTEDISGLGYGTYTVTVTDAYCGVAVLTVVVDSTTVGITEPHQFSNGINVFPNPVNSMLNITSTLELNQANVRVLDLSGKIILVESGKNGTQVQLNVAGLTKGVYVVEIMQQGMVSRQKFVKN